MLYVNGTSKWCTSEKIDAVYKAVKCIRQSVRDSENYYNNRRPKEKLSSLRQLFADNNSAMPNMLSNFFEDRLRIII